MISCLFAFFYSDTMHSGAVKAVLCTHTLRGMTVIVNIMYNTFMYACMSVCVFVSVWVIIIIIINKMSSTSVKTHLHSLIKLLQKIRRQAS